MLLIDLIDTWQGKPEHQDKYYNITLANRLATRYLKIHVKYDDRGIDLKPKNKATFLADLVMLRVYQDGVEYWQYTYDLLNRLISVSKNSTIKATYGYDPEGRRVIKSADGQTTHYVFEGTEPFLEKKIEQNKTKSYVYAVGKYLARVDGYIGDSTANVYYYHTDQLGSIRVVTDQSGQVVYSADYFAFGTRYISNGDFDEEHGFTGKEYDSDIGLYYYNARWYDSELGRFISEDPAADPNNPNLYSYCGNNPVIRTDPSGQFLEYIFWYWIMNAFSQGEAAQKGGNFWRGFVYGLFGNPTFGFRMNFGDTYTTDYNFDIQFPDYEYGIYYPDVNTREPLPGPYFASIDNQVIMTYLIDGGGGSSDLLPTSGYEPLYAPDSWNNDYKILISTNCYAYALDLRRDPKTKTYFPEYGSPETWGLQPGGLSKTKLNDDLSNMDIVIKKDAAARGWTIGEIGANEKAPPGAYKIAYLESKDRNDYHWYRQNPDGTWSHKPGPGRVTNRDYSGMPILNPELSNNGVYEFKKYYYVYIPDKLKK